VFFGWLTGRGLTFYRLCELNFGSGCKTVRFVAPQICLSSCCVAGCGVGPLVAVHITACGSGNHSTHNDVLTESICTQVFSCGSIPRLPVVVPWACASSLRCRGDAIFVVSSSILLLRFAYLSCCCERLATVSRSSAGSNGGPTRAGWKASESMILVSVPLIGIFKSGVVCTAISCFFVDSRFEHHVLLLISR